MKNTIPGMSHRNERGVAAVEFALVASIFFMLLFGALEMGRVLWILNSATEATRLGARLAVVCDPTLSATNVAIKKRMTDLLPSLTAASINITVEPPGCTRDNCVSATVSLSPDVQQTYIPFVNFAPALPPFTTTLSRESMDSTNNAVCT